MLVLSFGCASGWLPFLMHSPWRVLSDWSSVFLYFRNGTRMRYCVPCYLELHLLSQTILEIQVTRFSDMFLLLRRWVLDGCLLANRGAFCSLLWWPANRGYIPDTFLAIWPVYMG